MDAVSPLPSEAIPELLARLARHHVHLTLDAGQKLQVVAPSGALTEDLAAAVRSRRDEIVAWLARSDTLQHMRQLPQIEPDIEGRRTPFPLGDLQTAFALGDGDTMEFHVRAHYYLELEWPGLVPERYERALNGALARQRHNLLVLGSDMQLHALDDDALLKLVVHDLRDQPRQRQDAALHATRDALSRRTLPLDRWPWMEVEVSLYGDGQARLHVNNNNFFSDGYGTFKLLADARRLYEQPAQPLPPLALSYRDCVLALQRIEDSPLGVRARDYWLQRLPHLPGPPPVPLRPGLERRRRSWLERRETVLPATAWAAFQRTAQRHGVTPSHALFAVHAEVLSRWSGSRHFLLNNMVTHRLPLHPEIRDVLGNFASLYPLEVDWRDGGTFAERARRLQQRSALDVQHTHWSGVKVLQALNQQRRTPGQAPCPFVVGSGLFMPPVATPYVGCLETPQVMLDHQFWALQDGGLWAVWDVIEDCFPPGLIDAMWQGYRALLTGLAKDPALWDDEQGMDLLPADQRERRVAVNACTWPVPTGLLQDGLQHAAWRRPATLAVIDPDRRMTYAQVHGHANRLAHALLGGGVQRGDRVAVMLDKGWAQLVAVHAVLRAAAAYVAIDPHSPATRVHALLAQVQARHVVTRQGLRPVLSLPDGVQAWCVDDDALSRQPEATPVIDSRPDDLAYVIFTSGSTGQPKGVMIDHRGALNTVTDVNHRFGIGDNDVVFGLSALHFDLSVYDLFGTMAAGGTLVLPGPDEQDRPLAWVHAVRQHGVTVWNSVPALMQLTVDAATAAGLALPSLRQVLLSGDWIALTLPARVRGVAPNARQISLGGATEASIWSIFHVIDRVDEHWRSIPYGRPLAHQPWHVLDEQGRDAPDHVPGALYVGGVGLAQGYWGDPDKTASAFVTHPRTGERLYRTGDLGRYLPDGSIEFLGRADLQVKIQGLRVEPGEVEHAIEELPGVRAAAVVAHGETGARRLVAFVVSAHEGAVVSGELLQALRMRLPSHLVPAHCVVVDQLPLGRNGKVDRAALQAWAPAPGACRAGAAPRGPEESFIAQIWEQALNVSPIHRDDDFFALGGTSLLAIQVLSRIEQHRGVRLPLGALLEGRTVEQLARRVRQLQALSELVPLRVSPAPRGLPVVLVHPAGGGTLCYQALADALSALDPGCSVHALQARGLWDGEEPLDDVEGMARVYRRAWEATAGQAPCLLGGWSFGGAVAFEMARQWRAEGRDVPGLLLIDAPAPLGHAEVDDETAQQWFLRDVRRVSPQAPADIATLKPALRVFRAALRAGARYRPMPSDVDLLVLKAQQPAVAELLARPGAAQADWGWSALTTGYVRAQAVAGDHYGLLDAATAMRWAQCAHDWLQTRRSAMPP